MAQKNYCRLFYTKARLVNLVIFTDSYKYSNIILFYSYSELNKHLILNGCHSL